MEAAEGPKLLQFSLRQQYSIPFTRHKATVYNEFGSSRETIFKPTIQLSAGGAAKAVLLA
jgi:hypothetical protein